MSTVTIDTAQNVAIEYETASVGDRILATIIDGFVIAGLAFGIILAGLAFATVTERAWLIFLLILPLFFYHLLCEIFFEGQSVGKKVMKTRVVKIDGSRPTVGSYVLRWLLRILEVDMFYGVPALVAVIAGGKGQRLGDMAAGTTVIKMRENATMQRTVFEELEAVHEVTYPQAEFLSEEDIATVREFLDVEERDYEWGKYNLMAGRLAEIISQKMGVTVTQTPIAYLKVVLKDYNHIHGRL